MPRLNTTSNKLSYILPTLLLFTTLFLFAGAFLFFSFHDAHNLNVDESIHLSHSLVQITYLRERKRDLLPSLLTVSAYYPPLYPLISAFLPTALRQFERPFFLLFSFISVLITCWLILMFGWQEREIVAAKWAVCFFLLLPTTIFLSTHAYLEGALYPVVTLLYLLFSTSPFSKRKRMFAVSLLLAIGFLIKWTYLIFALFPLWFALRSLTLKDKVIRGGITLGLFLMLIYPWLYANDFGLFRLLIKGNRLGLTTGDPLPSSLFFYTYYIIYGFSYLFGPLFFLILLSLVLNITPTSRWAFALYLLFTLTLNKDPRFLIPCIPILLYQACKIKLSYLSPYARSLLFAAFLLGQILFLGHQRAQVHPRHSKISAEELGREIWQTIYRYGRNPFTIAVQDEQGTIHPYLLQYALLHRSIDTGSSLPFQTVFRPESLCTADWLVTRGKFPCSGYFRTAFIADFELWKKK